MKTLVLYYSRTGNTRTVAEAIARQLGADIEEIHDTSRRLGLRGYLRSGFDAALGRCTGLEPTRRDPADYDVVVVGTPVWNASVSAPVRTFLAANGRRMKTFAFFATQGGRGAPRAFRQMSDLVGRRPVTTLVLTERTVRHHEIFSSVGSFVRALESAVPLPSAPAVQAVPSYVA